MKTLSIISNLFLVCQTTMSVAANTIPEEGLVEIQDRAAAAAPLGIFTTYFCATPAAAGPGGNTCVGSGIYHDVHGHTETVSWRGYGTVACDIQEFRSHTNADGFGVNLISFTHNGAYIFNRAGKQIKLGNPFYNATGVNPDVASKCASLYGVTQLDAADTFGISWSLYDTLY